MTHENARKFTAYQVPGMSYSTYITSEPSQPVLRVEFGIRTRNSSTSRHHSLFFVRQRLCLTSAPPLPTFPPLPPPFGLDRYSVCDDIFFRAGVTPTECWTLSSTWTSLLKPWQGPRCRYGSLAGLKYRSCGAR